MKRCQTCNTELDNSKKTYCPPCREERDRANGRRHYAKLKAKYGVNPRKEYYDSWMAERPGYHIQWHLENGFPNEPTIMGWILQIFPSDEWILNDRTILHNPTTGHALELDMHNRTKGFAIEINGRHHKYDLFGDLDDKLTRDRIKVDMCRAIRLPLLQLDTSEGITRDEVQDAVLVFAVESICV